MSKIRWYVAATSANMEDLAATNLSRQGFRTFVPRYRKTVKHARKITVKRAPYFPGYIFTSLDIERHRWRSVNGTFGVRSLLMNGERPVPVPTGFVERLIETTDGNGLTEISSGLELGSRVKVLSGPFADLIGTLSRIDAEGRVRVLFEIMNGEIPVLLDRMNLIEAA